MHMIIKIALIVGARPNFMKAAPIMKRLRELKEHFSPLLIHTGQHYDDAMSKVFFDDLNMPQPDVYLGIGSGSHAEQTGRIMLELEKTFLKEKPDMVIVLGDINSTMAGALAAAKLNIPIAHIEAGLRSFDRSMPEEINRMVTDSISNYLFTTCEEANQNLLHEGHPEERIFFAGNVMIDSLYSVKEISGKSKILEQLGLAETDTVKPYGVLTLHRPSNVDDKKALTDIFEALAVVAKDLPIIFPVHPRTRKQIQTFGLEHYCNMVSDNDHKTTTTRAEVPGRLTCINPLGIVDFFKLLSRARLVMTDSGGITEETTVLKVPCLTMRDNTERSITVTEGTNVLVGNKKQLIIDGAKKQLSRDFSLIQSPRYWDGKASERIVDVLLKIKNELRQKVR